MMLGSSMFDWEQLVDVLLPMPALRLVFAAGIALALVSTLERVVLRPRGIVLGIPVKVIRERYTGRLDAPRTVDLEAHTDDSFEVRWLSPLRLLLLPRRSVHMHASSHSPGHAHHTRLGGLFFIGDLAIDEGSDGVAFHGRVLLRIVPLLAGSVLVIAPYLGLPWGLSWWSPNMPWWLAVSPLVMFGGAFAWNVSSARSGVEHAYHAVTAAFVAAIHRA